MGIKVQNDLVKQRVALQQQCHCVLLDGQRPPVREARCHGNKLRDLVAKRIDPLQTRRCNSVHERSTPVAPPTVEKVCKADKESYTYSYNGYQIFSLHDDRSEEH